MIRRQIEFPDNERLWLLVSQVDHAHVSGEIARRWSEEMSADVIDAIWHHDDGWAAWEAEPKLNPAIGAPFSFLEMPLPEALVIWDNSIAAARKIGPLAGYIVAGHFYNLLNESDHGHEPMAVAWLTAKRKFRTAWLDEWVRAAATHTLEFAKQAQQLLLRTDLFSLWLCCECPIAGVEGNVLDQSAMKTRADTLRGQFKFDVVGFGRRHPTPENDLEAFAWVVSVEPYPFKSSPVSLSAKALIAPAESYHTWSELAANSRPIELRWRLIPAGELTSAVA
jgi:hypothetical protein